MLTFTNKTTEWVKLEHNERLIVLFIRTRKWNNNTTNNNTNNFQYVKIFILTHFMALVSFYTPWNYQKTRGFLIVLVLGSIEKDQWHCNVLFVLQLSALFKINCFRMCKHPYWPSGLPSQPVIHSCSKARYENDFRKTFFTNWKHFSKLIDLNASLIRNCIFLEIFILWICPEGNYLLKVNKRNTRTRCELPLWHHCLYC